MAVDPVSQEMLLFGGYGNGTHLGDTWIFDLKGEAWRRIETASSPSPRAATTLVYEPTYKRFILFGGFNYGHSIVSNDTWAFDALTGTWIDLRPANSPDARASYGMAFDSKRGMVLLFGGFTEDRYFNDLWGYDPAQNSWHIQPAAGEAIPEARGAMGFSYDEGNDVFVLYGGFSDKGFFGDTWVYDPADGKWKEMKPEHHPPPVRTRMVYDNTTRQSIFFGGDVTYPESAEPGVEVYDGAWMYDYSENSWQKVSIDENSRHPQKRSLHAIAYNTATSTLILFGGTDSLIDAENFSGSEFQDMWVLSGNHGSLTLGSLQSTYLGPILIAAALIIVAAGTMLVVTRRRRNRSTNKQ